MPGHRGRVVILGGGVGGLSAGWALAGAGFETTLVERADRLGGLAVTKTNGPYRYDLGPHNIHTRHLPVLEFLRRHFPALFPHVLSSRIWKRGRWIEYPLRGARVLTSLPPARLPLAVLSFLRARLRMFLSEPARDDSFEAWIRNRFGDVLFREYFHDYPTKVWRLPPREIDRIVGEARVPLLGFTELLRAALLGRSPRIDHPEYLVENFYLPHGIGEIAEFFERGLRARGGRVLLGARATGVRVEGAKVRSVAVESVAGAEEIPCDHLLSTVPLPDLVGFFPDVPAEVRAAARSLDYCATILVFLPVRRRGVLPSHFVYFTEPEIPFSRVSDMVKFSDLLAPPGHSLLCLEFPCSQEDDVWRRDLASLAAEAVQILAGKGLLRAEEVGEPFWERLTHAYPRFRKGFAERVGVCRAFLGSHPNVLSYGRQGGFAYINTDGVIRQGFLAAAAVSSAEPTGFGLSEWFSAAL